MPKHSPKVMGWIWEKVKFLNFWGMDPLGCIWMLYVCSGDMVCALETWYVLYGHAICLLGIEYAVWTCYMSSGDGICCVDMLYVFWGWNMLYGHAICFLEMQYAVWTWHISSGDGICCMDMVYASLTWNIFFDMEYILFNRFAQSAGPAFIRYWPRRYANKVQEAVQPCTEEGLETKPKSQKKL